MPDRERVISELKSCFDDSIAVVVPRDTVMGAIALLKEQEQISFEGTFLKREDYVNIGDIIDCLTGLTLSTDAAFHAVSLIEWAMGKRAISKEELLKEQEPVEPIVSEYTALDNQKKLHIVCGNCCRCINEDDSYCWHCGRAVKWD